MRIPRLSIKRLGTLRKSRPHHLDRSTGLISHLVGVHAGLFPHALADGAIADLA